MPGDETEADTPEDEIEANIPQEIQQNSRLKNIYQLSDIRTDKWTYRKEAKIRDKYVKVRIRYTGDQLAVITAVLTLYTESYA